MPREIHASHSCGVLRITGIEPRRALALFTLASTHGLIKNALKQRIRSDRQQRHHQRGQLEHRTIPQRISRFGLCGGIAEGARSEFIGTAFLAIGQAWGGIAGRVGADAGCWLVACTAPTNDTRRI